MKKSILPFFLLFCSAYIAMAQVYHVSQTPLKNIPENRQSRSINAVTEELKPGDTVKIYSGIYREAVQVNVSGTEANPIVFMNAFGQKVEVSGADVIQNWQPMNPLSEDRIYVSDWQPLTQTDARGNYPENDYHKLVGRREMVSIMDVPLRQVLQKDRLERGTFFADSLSQKLYFWNSSNEEMMSEGEPKVAFKVETAVRSQIWINEGDHIKIEGIYFRQAANHALQGALEVRGNYNTISSCVFERNNSMGANFSGDNLLIENCTFQDNGQFGFQAITAHNSLMTQCTIRNNGWKGYKLDWAAGGNKILFSRRFIIDRCVSVDNRGNGIWYDIANEESEVRNCLIMNNQNGGIFYEISFGLHAHDNVILYNGLRSAFTAWGMAGGIAISSSPNCVIERNILFGNKEGFVLREQMRKSPKIEDYEEHKNKIWSGDYDKAIWNHDHVLKNNIIAYNRDAQTWGWFAVKDARFMPKTQGKKITISEEGHPVGLNLKSLNLSFENNIYASDEGNLPLFNWGVNWFEDKLKFTSLDAVTESLNLEQGSVQMPINFKSPNTLDFTVDAAQVPKENYPQGIIPGVILGRE
ncbi:right-handed parallel beta-helix repeat-containing protein [Maribacter sp. 2210JD10-5]|uniref:right-handed parallel beta-helix repeat-containing protein n=1 Tax=Maribacter sp. 2210JD10-5 TaxID=3386272 RepID=UPI0039BD9080